MDHLISLGDDGSWKQRCDEKLEQMKKKDFTRRADKDEDAGALQLREFIERYATYDPIMDSEIYKAIKNGDPVKFVDVLEHVCEKEKLSFEETFSLESHGGDSLLHVAAKYGSDKIAELVAFHHPYLPEEKNIKGNTPLHDAARSNKDGSKVIEVNLSQYAKWNNTGMRRREDLTRLKNRVGNTALHEAVACCYLEGVTELYHKDKAVRHDLNNSNKSPLYISVYNYMRWNNNVKSSQRKEKIENAEAIVDCLLQDSLANKSIPPQWNSGQSPLHAATEAMSDKEREQWLPGSQFFVKIVRRVLPRYPIFDFARAAPSSALLEGLVKKRPEMVYLKDEDGRSPLHFAALCGYSDGVRIMLKYYLKAALEFDYEGNLPIHLACKFGTIDVVKVLLTEKYNYPGHFVNQSGQNILHAAVMGGKHDTVKYILNISKHINIDLNETDTDGNTPLHLASKNMHPMVLLHLTRYKRVDLQCQNSQGLMARDIVLQQSQQSDRPLIYREFLSHLILSSANARCSRRAFKELRPNYYDINRVKDLVNPLMLVAILIATVTFAAGFTVPGSVYGSDDPNPQQRGMAVLAKRKVFQIFMVCNTAAMYSSTVGSFLLLWAQLGDYHLAKNSFRFALHMVALALTTMSGAFMAATRLILHNVSGLVIAIEAIGAMSILFTFSAYILFFFSFESNHPLSRLASNVFFRILIPFAGSYEIPEKQMIDTMNKGQE